jgi:hypothetical protein
MKLASFLLLTGWVVAHGQPGVAPREPDRGLILCWESDSEQQLTKGLALKSAVARAMALNPKVRHIGVRTESCAQRMPDAACFGVEGGVMCRISAIQRAFRAASWTVAKYALAGGPGYEPFRRALPRGVGYAFQYADGARAEPEVDLWLQEHIAEAGYSAVRDALVDVSLAALIGHEMAHTEPNDTCAIQTKAFVESSGLFSQLIKNEQSGEIFSAHNPSVAEVKGDACGLRHVYQWNQRVPDRIRDAAFDLAFVRRAGADLVAWQSATGWRKLAALPDGRYAYFSLDPYLYSPFRAMLFAAEVHAAKDGPAICGYAAEVIVQSFQQTFQKYNQGRGNIGDDVLAWLPKGVESAWNGQPWTPASFACGAEGSSTPAPRQ